MMAWATMSTLHGPPFVHVQLIPCGNGDTAFCHLRRQDKSTQGAAGQPLTCPHISLPLVDAASGKKKACIWVHFDEHFALQRQTPNTCQARVQGPSGRALSDSDSTREVILCLKVDFFYFLLA